MVRQSLPSVLSAWWLEQIMERHQPQNGAQVVNLHQKIPASPLAALRQQMALLNSRCQLITLKIGELSRFDRLSLVFG